MGYKYIDKHISNYRIKSFNSFIKDKSISLIDILFIIFIHITIPVLSFHLCNMYDIVSCFITAVTSLSLTL
jgi:hypothetical protein